jgi:hypothetical protein
MPSTRIDRDATVERLVAGRSEDQHGALDQRGVIGRMDAGRAVGSDPVAQMRLNMVGDDADFGARLGKQTGLSQRLVATADDDHGFAFDLEEDRECVELGGSWGHDAGFRNVCHF